MIVELAVNGRVIVRLAPRLFRLREVAFAAVCAGSLGYWAHGTPDVSPAFQTAERFGASQASAAWTPDRPVQGAVSVSTVQGSGLQMDSQGALRVSIGGGGGGGAYNSTSPSYVMNGTTYDRPRQVSSGQFVNIPVGPTK